MTDLSADLVVSAWLEHHAGLAPDATRAAGLASFIASRMVATRCEDTSAYAALLTVSREERAALLDRATIQETHFHRNRPQVEALRRQVLPEILLRASRERRPAVIWSAGCATGEEPYTVAMLVAELRAAMPDPPAVRILGTDISEAAIERAEAATYGGRTVQLAEDGALARWFDRQADGSFVVRPEVRQLVAFGIHNLLEKPPVGPAQADLILCRNVTIYFGRETTRGVVERLASALRPDGWLLLGAAETLWQISDDFEVTPLGEAFGYRRLPSPPAAAALPRPGAALPRALTAGTSSAGVSADRAARPTAPVRRSTDPAPARSGRPGRPGRPGATAVGSTAPAPARPAPPPGPVTNEQLAGSFLASARESLAIGRYDDALESAERAFATDPLLSDAYLLAGYLQCTLGRDDLAIDPLRKALFLSPGAGHAHFLLGAALRRVGDRAGALRSFRAAAQTLPHTPAAEVEPLLDGRPLSDLIALCRDLAESEVTP